MVAIVLHVNVNFECGFAWISLEEVGQGISKPHQVHILEEKVISKHTNKLDTIHLFKEERKLSTLEADSHNNEQNKSAR